MVVCMETLSVQKPPVSSATRIKHGRRFALKQAVELQKCAFETVLQLRQDIAAADDSLTRAKVALALAAVAKSWDLFEGRKRVLKNCGLPKPVRAANEKGRTPNGSRGYSFSQFSEAP
jgi:hypothetical protein